MDSRLDTIVVILPVLSRLWNDRFKRAADLVG